MSFTNVTPTPLVYSHSLKDLYIRFNDVGWSIKKVKFDKKRDAYLASATNAHGETIEKTGPDEGMAVRNLLLAVERKNHMRTAAMERIGMWKNDWTDQLQPIAEAYAKAPVYDPKAAAAFRALADDSMRRADVLRNQLQIEETNNPEPYPHAQAMADDIHKRQKFKVSTANSEHPMWTPEENTAFRIVHDVLGHGVSGGDFGWEGENQACSAHFPLLSEEAQKALFTECFTGDTWVRTRDHGYKYIADIDVGEHVLTGDGRFQPVLRTFERHHQGEILEITTTSSLGTIRVTPQHPFRMLIGDHPRKSKRLECSRTNCHRHPELHRFEWVAAQDLSVGGYVESLRINEFDDWNVINVPESILSGARLAARRGPTIFLLDEEFLWVIGMYIAEGSAGSGSLSFGLHRNERKYLARLKQWFEDRGYGTSVRYQEGNGVELSVYSTTLAEWWPQWIGKGCSMKQIPDEFLTLPSERLRPLVEGIMDGDGHYARNALAQTSPMLALQMAEISLRLGGEPTINIYPKKGKRTVYNLVEASADHKIKRRRGRRGHWNINYGHGVQITNIDRVPFDGYVHDLEVAGDHSFVVQNLIVHNCISQTAYAAHYRHFGPQKVALFPEFYEPVQRQEGVRKGFPGVHPSQSQAPKAMPAIKPSKPVGLPADNIAPHEQEEQGMPVQMNYVPGLDRTSAVAPTGEPNPNLLDPNANYQSPIEALPVNGYLHHDLENAKGRPNDPLQAEETLHNAAKIDTGWSQLKTPEGTPDYERMKQAIVNAFRVVLLSPRKDLKGNTIHYQDIQHIPPGVSDPQVYWDALENARQSWNVKRFGEDSRFSHRPYFKLIPEFEQMIYAKEPHAGWEVAKERAKRELLDWEQEEQDKVIEADEAKPENKQMYGFEIEKIVNQELTKRIENFLAERRPKLDHPDFEPFQAAARVPTQEDQLFPYEGPKGEIPDRSRYQAFMGTHLKAIAQISAHIDVLTKAAIDDVKHHDGAGHHFRATALQLGIKGVGPKVASFAWLLLQPTTSQLGTIDAHIMDVLGRKENEMNPRDYFQMERELQAGRNAAGYEHIPLGPFQWGMWDLKRTGPGTHQDHSGLRVLDPIDHNDIDFPAKEKLLRGEEKWPEPDWWANTKAARKQVGEEWNEQVTGPKTLVPFQSNPEPVLSKTAAVLRSPWLIHPYSGERLVGQPGQTLMEHTVNTLHLSTPQIWAALGDDNAGKETIP